GVGRVVKMAGPGAAARRDRGGRCRGGGTRPGRCYSRAVVETERPRDVHGSRRPDRDRRATLRSVAGAGAVRGGDNRINPVAATGRGGIHAEIIVGGRAHPSTPLLNLPRQRVAITVTMPPKASCPEDDDRVVRARPSQGTRDLTRD